MNSIRLLSLSLCFFAAMLPLARAAASAPPANDSFASRIVIGASGGTVTGDNSFATKETNEPKHAGNTGGRSVWWTWTPSASGNATINTSGTSFDTVLAVYTGSSVNALSVKASNDDFGPNHSSQVSLPVSAGTQYQIAVDGLYGAGGRINLTVIAPGTVTKVETPKFNPAPGTYTGAQKITLTTATSGATIRYTLNGQEPTSASAQYSTPITISTDATLKAKAFKAGQTDSDLATAQYTILIPKVETPTFTPAPSTFNTPQNVAIKSTTAGATIRYTLDGSAPTSTSTIYTTPLRVDVTRTIKARAFKTGMRDSDPNAGVFEIKIPQVAEPEFTPGPGTFTSPQMIAIKTTTPAATIRFTTNGANPTATSPIYNSPVPISATTTFKSRAYKAGLKDSVQATAIFVINLPQVAPPKFTPPPGNYAAAQAVSISTDTPGATIRYTTNGGEPTITSTLYTQPLTISGTTSFRARAFKTGLQNSSITSANYTINLPPVSAPQFSPPPGAYTSFQSVTITSATTGATIRYTTNGTSPSATSPLYTSPLPIHTNLTLKAKAFKTGVKESGITSGNYAINLPTVATPTFDPPQGWYTNSQNVEIASATPGATIRWTTNGTVPSATSALYTGLITLTTNTTLKARAFKVGMKDSATNTALYTIETRIVLLLHGMNSNPETWDDFRHDSTFFDTSIFNSAVPHFPIISGGVPESQTPDPDHHNVLYYRVEFGAFDSNPGLTGLETITAAAGGSGGDFTKFMGPNSLGTEVRDAVAGLLDLYPNAKILLVSHSRGGIAARSFLQTSGFAMERNAVVGLLTVGTPHKGSPFGRVYNYLGDARYRRPVANTDSRNDWLLVDEVHDQIDVRRPVIGDVAAGSSAINQLASSVSALPTRIKYGAVQYNGMQFGILYTQTGVGTLDVFRGSTGLIYSGVIFALDGVRHKLSLTASNYVCQFTPINTFTGDGIVPSFSQYFTGPAAVTLFPRTPTPAIVHIDEPKQKVDIHAAMQTLLNWWN